MSNAFKLGSVLKLVELGTNPVSAENGSLIYNTTDNRFKMYENGLWQQLASKSYVDTVAEGLDPKQSVRITTETDLSATYSPTGGTAGSGAFTGVDLTNGTILDGLPPTALAIGDRILVKNQTDAKENGIYVVTTAGATGALERASDQDGSPAGEVSGGNFVFIENGATYEATGWVLQGDGVLTLNTNDLDWVQFSAAGVYSGGAGILLTGTTFSVELATTPGLELVGAGDAAQLRAKVDGSTIERDASGLRIAASAAGSGLTGGGGPALAVGAGDYITVNADDVAVSVTNSAAGRIVFDGGSSTFAEDANLLWSADTLTVSGTGGVDVTTGLITNSTTDGDINIRTNGTGGVVLGIASNSAGDRSAVAGGHDNVADGVVSFIGGGGNNNIASTVVWAAIIGATDSTLTGTCERSAIAGGDDNTISVKYSFIGGGANNNISGDYSFIGGGNTGIVSGVSSAILGGDNNTASGPRAVALGGLYNTAANNGSLAIGGGALTAAACDFVIGNNTSAGSSLADNNHFRVAGDSSNMHLGRFVDQSAVAGAENKLYLHTIEASNQSKYVALKAPDSGLSSYTLTLPVNDGAANEFLQTDGTGVLTWAPAANTLNDLSDVTLTSPALNDILYYNGSQWVNQSATTFTNANVSIEDLSDVASMSQSTGDLLYWSGSAWSNLAVVPIANGGTNSSTSLTSNKLMVSNVGGTAIVEHSALTAAQVLYANGSGLPTGDANFTWDATTGLLIGATPIATGSKLTMAADASTGMTVESAGGSGVRPFIVGRKANGTIASPTVAATDDYLLSLGGKGYDGTGYSTISDAIIEMHAAETFSGSAKGTYISVKTTPVGTTSTVERMRIADAVIVKNNGLKLATASLSEFAHLTYLHGLTLTDNSTNPLSAITLDGASYSGQTVEYRITDGGNDVRVGTLRVALNTLNDAVSITDTYTETTNIGVTWSVAGSGAIATISYTTTSSGFDRTMHATVTRFLA